MKTFRPQFIFVCMFTLFLLLNLNFTILRSVRNTLAVVDLGGGAHLIPAFELLGAMPGAFFMTWTLEKLLKRYSIEKVFFVTLAVFLGFFILFSTVLYPLLNKLKNSYGTDSYIFPFFSMLFYTMSELWKPALAVILFWGLINQYVPVNQAKKLYAPLFLGGSVGSILAGPIISFCTSEILWGVKSSSPQHWTYSFNALIAFIVVVSIITAFLYRFLGRELRISNKDNHEQKSTITEKTLSTFGLLACLKNPPLRLLSWIVVADYFAYSLGEVIFLGILKIQYPNSSDYCNYMGFLSTWSGVITFFSSLLLAPYFLQKHRWVISAMVTPVCLLFTEGMFFLFLSIKQQSMSLFNWSEANWLFVVVSLGSLQYCLCRGAKYSFFDASKEISYVLMPDSLRMPGKLLVDGLSARFGRGTSSFLSLVLISLSGGVVASAVSSGVIAIGFTLSWISNTLKLGNLINEPKESQIF